MAEAEVMTTLTIKEDEKTWTLDKVPSDWEDFFMDDKNFMGVLEIAKHKARDIVADPTTKEGQIVRKSIAKNINAIIKEIDNAHDIVVKDLKAKPKKIDAVRKRVKDSLTQYKEDVLAPIKEIEARQAEIIEIDNMPAQAIGCDSVNVKYLIDKCQGLMRDEKYWKESWDDAQYSVNNSTAQLKDIYAKVKKQEDDAAELERRRKKEAEEADNAKKAADEAVRKAQAEAEAAKRAAAEAERKAAEEEAKRKAAEEEAAKAKKSAEEAQSASVSIGDNKYKQSELLFPDDYVERQRKCNREAMEALMEVDGIDKKIAKTIITMIVKGKVPHVRMEY